jgi:ABC-type sugar transport system permease subunit
MSSAVSQPTPRPISGSFSLSGKLIYLAGLAVLDAFTIWFMYSLYLISGLGIYLASAVALVTIGVNVFVLADSLRPYRWLSPGLALMVLLTLYPVLFTVFLSFTNYGTGHLLSKGEALAQITDVTYTTADAPIYQYTAFRSPDGEYLLWVIPGDGSPAFLLGTDTVLDPAAINAGPMDETGVPASIPGYQRLTSLQLLPYLDDLGKKEFGDPPNTVKITTSSTAQASLQRYNYNAAADTITDEMTGAVYHPVNGTFVTKEGQQLSPGYIVPLGGENYTRVCTRPAFAGPFFLIFIWTIIYAFLSVALTFALGLFLAIVYNDHSIPPGARRLLRSLLIIPYAIPAFIGVQIWVALLNPQYGVINKILSGILGVAPAWFADPIWAKTGVLLVQLWLGFPYMMLVCTGALQSIPKDLYQAAQVDGASVWNQFRNITLPLILITVSPLLVASFAFNFNNFTVIDIYNQGGPPMANSPTPAGHTDILISYTFRLAFGSGGSDYGYASAITVIIFVVLSVLTFFQFRKTQQGSEA